MSERKRIVLQVALFLVTFITTTMAGAQMAYGRYPFLLLDQRPFIFINGEYTWADFFSGLEFSVPLLLFLTAHEFGHYFVAIYHRVKTSLPYYIPFPPIFLVTIGTLGAVIRLRSRPASNVQSFDIGLAGPLAGFLVAIAVLFYGFKTLPPADHIFQFHPEYKEYGLDYAKYVYEPEFYARQKVDVYDVTIGTNLIFSFFGNFIADPARVPNAHELMHYPVLLAGFLGLFFTCLNLLPIGQLDGGHVAYGLFGYKRHRIIASVFMVMLLLYGGFGIEYINPALYGAPLVPDSTSLLNMPTYVFYIPLYILFLYFALRGLSLSKRDTAMYAVLIFAIHFIAIKFFPQIKGNATWLFFGFITGGFLGVRYPQSHIEEKLDPMRLTLGWIALIIFVLCFSLSPIDGMEFKAPQ
jgi:membrane-associated protease RseP (regulator of RpoE activity)